MSKESKSLIGRQEILDYLRIGKGVLYDLMKRGLPVRRVGSRLVAHQEALDEWFKADAAESK